MSSLGGITSPPPALTRMGHPRRPRSAVDVGGVAIVGGGPTGGMTWWGRKVGVGGYHTRVIDWWDVLVRGVLAGLGYGRRRIYNRYMMVIISGKTKKKRDDDPQVEGIL